MGNAATESPLTVCFLRRRHQVAAPLTVLAGREEAESELLICLSQSTEFWANSFCLLQSETELAGERAARITESTYDSG